MYMRKRPINTGGGLLIVAPRLVDGTIVSHLKPRLAMPSRVCAVLPQSAHMAHTPP